MKKTYIYSLNVQFTVRFFYIPYKKYIYDNVTESRSPVGQLKNINICRQRDSFSKSFVCI